MLALTRILTRLGNAAPQAGQPKSNVLRGFVRMSRRRSRGFLRLVRSAFRMKRQLLRRFSTTDPGPISGSRRASNPGPRQTASSVKPLQYESWVCVSEYVPGKPASDKEFGSLMNRIGNFAQNPQTCLRNPAWCSSCDQRRLLDFPSRLGGRPIPPRSFSNGARLLKSRRLRRGFWKTTVKPTRRPRMTCACERRFTGFVKRHLRPM